MTTLFRLAVLAVTGILVASLVGCSSPSTDECTPAAKEGDAVSSIKVSLTTPGTAPTATFKTPISTTDAEVKIIKSGDGARIKPGDAFRVELAFFNGQTGQAMGSTAFNDKNAQVASLDTSSPLSFLNPVLKCAQVGSRIVGVVPNSLLVSADGSDLTGGSKDMTLVVIADVVSVSLQRANGDDQPAISGMPLVTLAENGAPTIRVPPSPAPSDIKVAVLKKGSGPVVTPKSTVTVHYTGVLWDGGSVFDSSWSRKQSASFSLSQVVPGFAQALSGQSVGSQILAVIPPSLAYGAAGAGASVPPNATLVFVIDILGIAG